MPRCGHIAEPNLWPQTGAGSIRLDPGEFDDLAPFLSFVDRRANCSIKRANIISLVAVVLAAPHRLSMTKMTKS